MGEVEMATALAAVEQRSKSNSHRLDALEKQTQAVSELATSVAVMAEKVETTGDKVDGLCTDVQELKAKPGKRWEQIVTTALTVIVSAVIGYFLARIGL
nr:MAG TPA: hypothetical protein [Caudoviricetes sp.]